MGWAEADERVPRHEKSNLNHGSPILASPWVLPAPQTLSIARTSTDKTRYRSRFLPAILMRGGGRRITEFVEATRPPDASLERTEPPVAAGRYGGGTSVRSSGDHTAQALDRSCERVNVKPNVWAECRAVFTAATCSSKD